MLTHLVKYNRQINHSYLKKHTNFSFEDDEKYCCYITQKALLHLFECKTVKKSDANYIQIYMEYKNVGHGCCIYDNKLLQSFATYHYLQLTPIDFTIDELLKCPSKYLHMFYPPEFLEMDGPENVYIKCTYFITTIDNNKLMTNLKKLLDS